MLGKRIEVGGVLFSWLIPYVTEIMNKFKVGSDGRTAYERITGHKCRHIGVGFGECVNFMLETDQWNRHKADSELMSGVFLGYVWRTTEYIVGTKDGIFKCRTVRRKNVENAYDPNCVEYLTTSYNDYVMKDARTTPVATRVAEGPMVIPQWGREFVPRRIYTKPADYTKHGYTQGCRGCAWLENQIGPRQGHSEICRSRIEKAIAEDETDDRTRKAKERADHHMYQRTKADNEEEKRAEDPRPEGEPNPSSASSGQQQQKPIGEPTTPAKTADGGERFLIGTPGRPDDDMGVQQDELEEGPNVVSERRLQSPARAPATKRKVGIHDEESSTKVIIRDDGDDAMGGQGVDIDAVQARRDDEEILCRAILGLTSMKCILPGGYV